MRSKEEQSATFSYSIVIPCYRSGKWLEELVRRIQTAMSPRGEPFEVLLINDASPDNTWEVIEQLADRYSFVKGIDLTFNTGQYRSTLCGLEYAAGELIITMDDDLQHAPEEIPVLIDEIIKLPGLDCVMARYDEKHQSTFRNLGSKLALQLYTSLYNPPPGVVPTSFRIMKRDLAKALCQHRTVNPIIGALLLRTTRRIANVTVKHYPRVHGRSGYHLRDLIRIMLDNYISSTTAPLKVLSMLGLCSASMSFFLGIYYLSIFFLRGFSVTGFITQVLLILFFGGMILFSVGLLGEYVTRIMDEVRRSPRYIVRSETRSQSFREREVHVFSEHHE